MQLLKKLTQKCGPFSDGTQMFLCHCAIESHQGFVCDAVMTLKNPGELHLRALTFSPMDLLLWSM